MTILVLVLLLGACNTAEPAGSTAPAVTRTSSHEAATASSESGPPAPEATTTTVARSTTTVAATTTDAATQGDSACLVGTWELDEESFLALIEGAAGEASPDDVEVFPSGGIYQMTAAADGMWTAERIDWGFVAYLGDNDEITVILNGTDTGTWAIDGDDLVTTVDRSDVVTSITSVVAGGEVDLGPDALPPGFETEAIASGSARFGCTDEKLSVGDEQLRTVWIHI
jgi:hypothetical protein